MRTEILTFNGCPNAAPARTPLAEVARELGRRPVLEAVLVEDVEQAERLRFLGSPTIRVDGHDFEPGADARTNYAFSSRVYATPDGPAGLPPRASGCVRPERADG